MVSGLGKRAMILAFQMVVALGCASAPSTKPGAAPEVKTVEDTALGESDVVEIKVFREPDLAGVYRVAPSGEIDFPFIGKVIVLGKDANAVAEEIRARLADGFLKNPQVSVFVREHNSQKIHVLGQVNKAGTFSYQPGMTIVEAITLAGGFTKLAATNRVRVTRVIESKEQVFDVPVGDIGSGKAPNFQLRAGDIVFAAEAIF